MKKKHKIVDAIKFVCEKKETGTLVVVTDDNQFATFSLVKGEIVSIGYQGQYGVEAIELIACIGLGVCRFRRDRLSSRRDPLPNTEDIITHFLQHATSSKTDAVPINNDNEVEGQQRIQQSREDQNEKNNIAKEALINTLTVEQKRIFETCLAEYIGAMAPILAEEYLEIETSVDSAINSLVLVVRSMSGTEDAKKFNQNIVGELKKTGLNYLSTL
jgi:hypothetical protein